MMKKLLIVLFLLISCTLFSQGHFPVNSTVGSPKSTVLTKGISAADSGFQYRTGFVDTLSANNGNLKYVPGVVIRVNSDLWIRDENALSWIKIGVSGGSTDSTIFATLYRVDTAKTNIRASINAKADSGTVWKRTGNGGTSGTDFIGTPDNNDLVVKTNNQERVRVKTNGNTYIRDTARTMSLGTIPSDSSDFEIAIFPDIQNMIRYNQAYSRSMFKWLADSAASRNVKAMLQVGDITDWNTNAEWDTLNSQLSLITGSNLPYMFVPGNHDYGNGFNPSGRDATKYNANLGVAHYTGKPFYGGHFGSSNENFWIQFTAAGKKYVAVGLEFLPRDSVVTWAGALIDSIYIADPEAEVIIVTHAYQTMFGELATDTSYYSGGTYGMSADNSGYELWNKLIRKKANIRWVFSGHFLIPNGYAGSGLTDKLIVTGDNGNIINQIFINYQDDVNWGDGYFLRLKFKPSKGTVDASFYSSYYNAYDTRIASYTLDDPSIAVKSSMGVSGNMSVNKDLRIGGELKVDSLHKGGVPFVFEDHIIKDDTNFRYIPRNYFGGDSLTVGKILLRKYTQKNDPLFYVNDSLGNRTFEMRSQTKDGIASLFMGVGAGRNWNTHRTDIYTESGSIGIGNKNLYNLDSGFAVISLGDRAFHEARSIIFATGVGRAVGYSVLRGQDFDLYGNSVAATATEINRSAFFGSDAGALITGKIEGATVFGVGAARQGAKVDSSAIYGRGAVRNSTSAKRAVVLGFEAAQSQTNADDMLWIHNSNSASPLFSGRFDARWIKVDGDLTVTDTLTATTMGLSDSSDRAATTKWVKQQLYGSGGGGSSDSSIFLIDTTYDRLAKVLGTDSLILKSVRIRMNGSTVTPTATDTTLSYDIITSEPGLADSMAVIRGRYDRSFDTIIYVNDSTVVWQRYDGTADTLQFHPGGSTDSSTFLIDTTYDRLAKVLGTDSLVLKSIRLRMNGTTVTPTVTDTTLSYDIITSEPGLADSMAVIRGRYDRSFDTIIYVNDSTVVWQRYDGTADTLQFHPGGSGLTKGTTTISSSATRRILYDSSGVLSNNANFVYNASGELIIGGSTDNGAYTLQVNGGNSFFSGNIYTTGTIFEMGNSSRVNFGGAGSNPSILANSTSLFAAKRDNSDYVDFTAKSITATNTVTTGNPGSGAGAWKLGTAVTTSGLVLNTTTYVEVSIGGTVYRLAVVDPPQP